MEKARESGLVHEWEVFNRREFSMVELTALRYAYKLHERSSLELVWTDADR